MRRWLMLRSGSKKAKAKEKRPPLTLLQNDDMWTHLFHEMIKADPEDIGELLWWSKRDLLHAYNERLMEGWSSLLDRSAYDVIFNRGGYAGVYNPILNQPANAGAKRIYYGAGMRWNPPTKGVPYHLILVDTPEQKAIAEKDHPWAKVEVIWKPAAPMFKPVIVQKEYDVVFISHTQKEFKGYKWLIAALPDGSSVLRVGAPDPWFQALKAGDRCCVDFTGNIPRSEIPALACKAKVGVVCDDGEWDSGPRTFSELLAMNIPVLVRPTVRIDQANLVNSMTVDI